MTEINQDKGSIKLYTDAYKLSADKKQITVSGTDIKKALNKFSKDKAAEGIYADIAEVYALLCLQGFTFKDIMTDTNEIRPEFAKFLADVSDAKGKNFKDYQALMDSGKAFVDKRPEKLLSNANAFKFLYSADGLDDTFDGLKDLRHFEVTIRYEVGRDKALGVLNTSDADADTVDGEAIDAFINVRNNYYATEKFVVRQGSAKVITDAKNKAKDEAVKVTETDAGKIVALEQGKDGSQEEIKARFVGDDGMVDGKGREGYFFNWFLTNHNNTSGVIQQKEAPVVQGKEEQTVKKDEKTQAEPVKVEVLEVKDAPTPDKGPEGYAATPVLVFMLKDDANKAIYRIYKKNDKEEYTIFDKDLKPVDTLIAKKNGDAYDIYKASNAPVTEKVAEKVDVKEIKEVKENPADKDRKLTITGSGLDIVIAEPPKDAKIPKGSGVIYTFTVNGDKTVYQLIKGEDNTYSVINSVTGEKDYLFGIKLKDGEVLISRRELLSEAKKTKKKKQKIDMNTYWQGGKNTWVVQLPGWKKASHGRYEFSLKKGETLLAVFTDGSNDVLLPAKNDNLESQPKNVFYAVKDSTGAVKVYKLMEWQKIGGFGEPQLQTGYDISFLPKDMTELVTNEHK